MVGWWGAEKSAPLPQTGLEIYLASRPHGAISEETFGRRQAELPALDALPPGHVLVRVQYVSCDPAMRGWMSAQRSYIAPVAIGDVMRATGVGVVVAGDGWRVGECVQGLFGWAEFAVVKATDLRRVSVPSGLSPSVALGVLGTTGMTAYFGLLDVGKPVKGDCVVVSAAAGATGSVVAQIAKHVLGCTTVGIAGGEEKCRYLTEELGLDAAVDYKHPDGVDEGLKKALNGKGIDVYFDNVGGPTLEAVLKRINQNARIVLCGAISVYNETKPSKGPSNYLSLIMNRARMEG